MNKAVAKGARRKEAVSIRSNSGHRRDGPGGANPAMRINPPLRTFGAENVTNGIARPYLQPNAWVAALGDPAPALTLAD
jgi:hypothetical protein